MSETKQSHSQTLVVKGDKIGEKEKAEYIKILDDLCAVLENYSATLTKNISAITGHRDRLDKLRMKEILK